MKFAPVASLVVVVGLASYFLGISAPSTPAQSGWSGVPTMDQLMGRAPGPFAVPHPRDWVQIREVDGPYTVPAGKILVLTGLGISANVAAPAYLYIDGQFEASATPNNGYGNGTNTKDLSFGITASAGQIVTLDGGGNPYGRAYGYLVDE